MYDAAVLVCLYLRPKQAPNWKKLIEKNKIGVKFFRAGVKPVCQLSVRKVN